MEMVSEQETDASRHQALDFCLLATVMLVLCYGPHAWYANAACRVLMTGAVLFSTVRKDWRLWAGVAGVVGVSTALNWTTADNHKYLLTYWCIAVACTLSVDSNRIRVLAANGRWLVGLVMLFGALWKLASPTYRSGSFFEFAFLTDDRFAAFVSSLTSMTKAQLSENAARLALLTSGYADGINPQSQEMHFEPGVRMLAQFTTWWTVLIEGTCAAAFLLPKWKYSKLLRHGSLLLFALTTYLIVPVAGFGCLLLIMGLAQCEPDDKKTRWAYVGLFTCVLAAPILFAT